MEDDECLHGMTRAWCGICSGTDAGYSRVRTSGAAFHGGSTKQDLLDEICKLLDIPRETVGEGSSLPSGVFNAVAEHAEVQSGTMPEIGERTAAKAGLTWGPECDSRGTPSAGGSTVTREGLEVLLAALTKLDARP